MINLTGKTILITGGTGSFGKMMVTELLSHTGIKEIRVFSRDEEKQDAMRHSYNDRKIKFYIGDVRDFNSLNNAFYDVDYVFAAAALKQVPSCEFYPMEAVKTNVIGTENTLRAAIENNVKNVVILSTDKAVYPINAMGMTKALSEKIVLSYSQSVEPTPSIFCCTRYGNIMASRGSVIPLFMKQIQQGADITVTDPNMTRFMMTLPQSVTLVLYAFEHARHGDIFVQKAPAATIGTLALALIELFNSKSKIKIIGTRHGEKLYETLLSREEMVHATEHGDYYRVPADTRDLNYEMYLAMGNKKVSMASEYNSHNTTRLDKEALKSLLLTIPEVRNKLN